MKVSIGPELVSAISLAYKANTPVLIGGTHGIGKSEVLKQVAEQLGIGIIIRDLSLMEPPDLTGIPRVENGRTVYAPPAFLPKDKAGLLVFEELNRAEKYMMAPCLQLLTERTLNDYSLPKGWLPMAAINPAEDGYDVTALDPALHSRFVYLECTATPKRWLDWARTEQVHPAVCEYVERTADVFESSDPRSWTMVSNLVKAFEDNKADFKWEDLRRVVSGKVGNVHGHAFSRAYQDGGRRHTDVSPESVLKRFESVRVVLEGWHKTQRTDELSAAALAMMKYLQNGDCADAVCRSSKQKENLRKFIKLLPADIGKGLRSAAKDGGVL